MQRFAIFKKSDKIYWSRDKVVFSVFRICLVVYLIKSQRLKIEENFVDKGLMFIILGFWIGGFVLKFLTFNKVAGLRGELDGFLSIDEHQSL